MGNRFDEFMYGKVHEILEEHDDIVAERCVAAEEANVALKEQLDLMQQVIKDLKTMTREWMKDLVYLTYTEEPSLLAGKIYALVSSFPQNYRVQSTIYTIKDKED